MPGEAVYAASKHAVMGFSLSTAADLRLTGVSNIDLSCICPDGIWTPMLHDKLDDPASALSFSGTLLQPADVVAAVARVLDRPRLVTTLPAGAAPSPGSPMRSPNRPARRSARRRPGSTCPDDAPIEEGHPVTPRIAIIGAGFGGIAAAIALRARGHDDITILEKGNDVGGVWRRTPIPVRPATFLTAVLLLVRPEPALAPPVLAATGHPRLHPAGGRPLRPASSPPARQRGDVGDV